MRSRFVYIATLLVLATATCCAQNIPLVYNREYTVKQFALPPLPAFEQLPTVRPLPDPFAWSDGSGRSTEFTDWSRRRTEIKAEIEHYGIGRKPPKPTDIQATFSDGILTVRVTDNDETLTLTARVRLPKGEGPFPAVIGIGRGSGSLPREMFPNAGLQQLPSTSVRSWRTPSGGDRNRLIDCIPT